MFDETRFQINELITQYTLHPDFKDIFVEGIKDKKFYRWFLNKAGFGREIQHLEIERVHIPPEFLRKYNLSAGSEKNKVIALALELSESLPANSKAATCIVDADFDYLFGNLVDCHLLLYTDYTCLEMYTFTPEVFNKLAMGTSGFPKLSEKIVKEIKTILVDLFLVRATNIDLGLNIEWLEIKGRRYTINNKGGIYFNIKSFVKDYLEKNNLANKEERFWKRFNKLKKLVSGDLRKFIRGKDYIELLGFYLYKKNTKLRYLKENPDRLAGALLMCLEANDLCNEYLFSTIVSRIS